MSQQCGVGDFYIKKRRDNHEDNIEGWLIKRVQ